MNTKQVLLCFLAGGAASGYDIKKTFELRVSQFIDVGISNIYPALNELAADGLVKFEKIDQEGRPAKKVYRITGAGRKACVEALMSAQCDHAVRSEFLFVLVFTEILPPSRIETLLAERIAKIDEQLALLDDVGTPKDEILGTLRFPAGSTFCRDFFREVLLMERNFIATRGPELVNAAAAEAVA